MTHLLVRGSLVASLLCTPTLAFAQPAAEETEPLVVTANRTEVPISQVGNSITVITAEDLEKVQAVQVLDVLQSVPGVSVTQVGSVGGQSSIFIRGAQSYHTLVLIDGVIVSDAAAPQNVFQIEHLLAGDIERIEILRGSQSTLYGSDAIGGVVNIITKAGKKGLQQSLTAQLGSFGTEDVTYSLSGGTDRATGSFTAQFFNTGGFSAGDENDGNSEDDGYENLSVSGKGRVAVTDQVSVYGAFRRTEGSLEFDDNPGVDADDNNEFRQVSVRGGIELNLFNDRLSNDLSASYTENSRRDKDEAFGSSSFYSERVQFDYQGVFEPTETTNVVFGVSHRNEDAKNSFGFEENVGLTGYFLTVSQSFLDRLFLNVGGRVDDHETFGTFETYRVSAAYNHLETGTILRASHSTGFRAPSLNELFGSFSGNPDLEPEETKSFDVGIEQSLFNDRVTVGATYFDIEFEDFIDFDNVFFVYFQAEGRSEIEGIETFATFEISPNLSVGANYTYTDSRDEAGDRRARRPYNQGSASVDYQFAEGRGRLGLDVQSVVNSVDTGSRPLNDYARVTLRGDFQVNDLATLFARIENAGDEEYQQATGFGTADRAFYTGIRLKW
ncbi:MAG: TonB-dependent receptor [Pseudomonadota bacterium]